MGLGRHELGPRQAGPIETLVDAAALVDGLELARAAGGDRLRRTKPKYPIWLEALMKCPNDPLLQLRVEIDQKIAACDHVEP